MTPPRSAFPPPVRRLDSAELSPSGAPPLILIILGLILLLVCAAGWRKVDSSQLLMHLKAGERIVTTHQVPSSDVYSVTSDPNGWTYVEWVWGTTLAAVHSASGWAGVNGLNVALIALTAALLLWRARRRSARWGETLAVTALVLAALAPGFQPTPERAAGVLFLLALIVGESRRLWPLIFLPVIALVWANVHTAFLLAASVPFFRLAFPPRSDDGSRAPNPSVYLFVIITTCLAAALINPNSVQIARAVYRTVIFSAGQTVAQAADTFSDPAVLLQIFAALMLACAIVARRRFVHGWEIALAVILTLAVIISPTTLLFLLLYLAAPAAAALSQLLATPWHTRTVRYAAGAAVCLATVAMLAGSLSAARLGPTAFGTGLRPGAFPETAAGRLAAIPLRNALLNMPEDGGYLAWRIWPSWKITMDQRPALYTPEQRRQYDLLWLGGKGWDEILNLWRVHAVLGSTRLAEDHPNGNLFFDLADSAEWQPVYWDSRSILYVQKSMNLGNSNLQYFRQLKPGISWPAQAARMRTPDQWRELAADLRRVTLDDPKNVAALEFLQKAEAQAAR